MAVREEAIDVMDGNNFAEALEANVNVSYLRLSKPRMAAKVARATLANRWDIDHKKALNAVRMSGVSSEGNVGEGNCQQPVRVVAGPDR